MAKPLTNYIFTDHALGEMARRGIEIRIVEVVVSAPDRRLPVRTGRDVLQSQVDTEGRVQLVRVVADVDRDPAEIVTVYRTSKIAKYWSMQS